MSTGGQASVIEDYFDNKPATTTNSYVMQHRRETSPLISGNGNDPSTTSRVSLISEQSSPRARQFTLVQSVVENQNDRGQSR